MIIVRWVRQKIGQSRGLDTRDSRHRLLESGRGLRELQGRVAQNDFIEDMAELPIVRGGIA
jgi:hypothetical protein